MVAGEADADALVGKEGHLDCSCREFNGVGGIGCCRKLWDEIAEIVGVFGLILCEEEEIRIGDGDCEGDGVVISGCVVGNGQGGGERKDDLAC